MYRLLRPFLYLFAPERAHHLAFGLLRFVASLPLGTELLRSLFMRVPPSLRVRALGRDFALPVGLAAGFDKDAIGYDALLSAGFGFVEVGTLTGEAQPGNPSPRLFRLTEDRALVNRMGFNNEGSLAAVPRLSTERRGIVGVNIGKTKIVPEEQATADYVRSAERLGPLADYLVVNVSSPNTPGLRNLQATDKLAPLLREVREALARVSPDRHVPLLVKIAPDLAAEDVDAVADLALELGLDGIIATNTTLSRANLATPAEEVRAIGAGGLSGPVLRARSLAVLRRLRGRVGNRLTLISVGGIETGADAYARFRAGASLVQVYTAYVYEGPGLPGRIATELVSCLHRDGYDALADVIGLDAVLG